MFNIRRATIKDLNKVYNLLYPHHFNQAIHPKYSSKLVWSERNARQMMTNYFSGIVYIAELANIPVGVVVLNVVYTYYQNPEADIEMFYIVPECRRTELSRLLAKLIIDEVDRHQAEICFMSYHSGGSDKNHKLWENLWKKFGFVRIGTTMIRSA